MPRCSRLFPCQACALAAALAIPLNSTVDDPSHYEPAYELRPFDERMESARALIAYLKQKPNSLFQEW